MKCSKCGAESITMTKDSRGIPEARCNGCGAFIKKMSTSEVIEYFESREGLGADSSAELPAKTVKPKCRYCTENYFMRQGRLGTIYTPVETKFCPMCGREHQSGDRDYK